jgi:DNA-binding NarL/FixJ family response regulator
MTVSAVPDLLLLDVAMPPPGGMAILESVARQAPTVKTLLLTASIGRQDVVRALELGVRGVLLKEHATPLLFASIRAVLQGQYWVDRAIVGKMVDAVRDVSLQSNALRKPSNRFGLTARELEVVGGIKMGESNREIGTRLSVREDTIKHHLSRIFDKLGVYSRVELAVFAINHGLEEIGAPAAMPIPPDIRLVESKGSPTPARAVFPGQPKAIGKAQRSVG